MDGEGDGKRGTLIAHLYGIRRLVLLPVVSCSRGNVRYGHPYSFARPLPKGKGETSLLPMYDTFLPAVPSQFYLYLHKNIASLLPSNEKFFPEGRFLFLLNVI